MLHRLRSFFGRTRAEHDLDEEIRDHLERDIADRVRRGADPAEARRAAMADFGGVEGTKDGMRDQQGIPLLEHLWRDARHAARRIAREPRYALLVILTIGLGVGAGTAVFSAVDGVLFKPLQLAEPDAIFTVWKTRPADGVDRDDFAPGTWLDLRERTRAFSSLAAANPFGVSISTESSTERVDAWQVSREFFPLLGVTPFLGRSLEPGDFEAGAAPVAVLDHGFWQRRFGGDPQLVGTTLRLDGRAVLVAGIMPPGLELPEATDLWQPWVIDDGQRQDRFSAYIRVFGRLAPGVTPAQAQAELDGFAQAFEQEYPRSNTGIGFNAISLEDHLVGARRPLLYTLLGAAGILLVVALANVAALHLTRLTRQRHETALRAMLGASATQLARPLVVEAFVLALLGGITGLAIGWAGVRGLHALGPADLPRMADIALDGRAAAAAGLLALAAAVVLALLPLSRFARPEAGSRTVAGHRTATRGRRTVVGAQIALGLVLLIGTSLLARSFLLVLSADRGYRTDNVLSFTTWVYDEYPDGARRFQFVREVLDRLAALPGVEAVAMGSALPLADEITGEQAGILPEGAAAVEGEERTARGTVVWPTYFETLGIPLRSGRTFTLSDDGRAAPIATVNETFVRRFLGGEDPIGKTVRVSLMGRPIERTVVGVVADTRHARLDAPPEPAVFIPWTQQPLASLTFIMRTSVDPGPLGPQVTKLMYDLDPRVVLARIATMDALVDRKLRERRFLLILLGAFALGAVLIAAVGVFGVMSQAATERGREIAVRMALGASPRTILGEFLSEAGWMTVAGLAAGLAIAVVATRALTRFLFEVAPLDALSIGAAAATVLLLALVAAALPGLRAARTSPARILQDS
jgi:predicted permease